jgi:hypothetical protein
MFQRKMSSFFIYIQTNGLGRKKEKNEKTKERKIL